MRQTILIIIILLYCSIQINSESIIIDSNMTFKESIKGTNAPDSIINELKLINVMYYSDDGKLHRGQLVISKSVSDDINKIFEIILKEKFVVHKCVPIVKYNWSDAASMEDNNTSSFNYRKISNSKNLSRHSYGMAIDINPYFNPVVYRSRNSPKTAKYNSKINGTLTADSKVTKEFIKMGWRWGGNFKSFKDYHHFDKKIL